MGVSGLETFMHNHPECCESVNIRELALAYSTKYNKTPELILGIDNCYLRFLYKKPWLSGCQMKELAYMFENILKKLESFGIKVTAFISGLVHPDRVKHQRTILVQKAMKDEVNKIFDSLHSNKSNMDDVSEMYFPNNFRRVIIETFKKCKCQIFQPLVKVNIEAAMYAKKNNCFGILAQDSDFIIFNSAEYYFSLLHLNLETFDTLIYKTDKLAEVLKLTPRQLPLVATAMGNAYLNRETLMRFHRSLFRKGEKYSRQKTFYKVVDFLKKNVKRNQSLASQLPDLSKKMLGSPENAQVLQYSLGGYDMDAIIEDNYIHTDDDKWNQIQKKLIEEHKSAKLPYNVYGIVFYLIHFQKVDLEDPNKDNHLWFEIAKKLRRKIYGILLINKPNAKNTNQFIQEIHIDNRGQEQINQVQPIYPEIEVNLLELWSADDDDKWDLFCSTLNIQKEILHFDDKHIIIPVASLSYLMMENFKISSWELEAVLASVLLLQYYSIEDLEEVPELPLDPDGIHLYWYLMKIFELVAILNSICGFPLESDLANPIHYQDGKLFHHKYRQAKENQSFENLCESRTG